MGVEQGRAQRWHDTDHGAERGKPLRPTRFIVPRPEPEPDWFSACWCCCEVCDPDWNPDRFNPYWAAAQEEMRVG